jgi:hypothetical protein
MRVRNELASDRGRSTWRCVVDHYRQQPLFMQGALFGLIGLVIAPVTYFTVAGQTTFGLVTLVIAVMGGAAFLSFGALHGLWLAGVIRNGIRSTGRVLSAGRTSARGEVVGQLSVEHTNGWFISSFREDASWATRLAPGTLVDVVVDRQRPKLLLVLGPQDDV